MDNADAIPDSAWTALDTIMSVPLWMWVVGGAIGLFGITLLVFLFASCLIGKNSKYTQETREWELRHHTA
jgi:hypothetical protein